MDTMFEVLDDEDQLQRDSPLSMSVSSPTPRATAEPEPELEPELESEPKPDPELDPELEFEYISESSQNSTPEPEVALWEGALQCHVCQKTFRQPYRLRKHGETHLSIQSRPRKCDQCDIGFLNPKDLKRHKNTIHRNGPRFMCPMAGCRFARVGMRREDNLRRHIRTTHAEQETRHVPGRDHVPSLTSDIGTPWNTHPPEAVEENTMGIMIEFKKTAMVQTVTPLSTAFFSARSFLSGSVSSSLPSRSQQIVDGQNRPRRPQQTVDGQHTARARAAGLVSSEEEEVNWSGFGEHVQFSDEAEIPLIRQKVIFRSSRAIVDAVQCKRIILARKTMLCHRRFTPEEALEEVRHLKKLEHRHIVRLVGSYTQGKLFSILTYPVADRNLEEYTDRISGPESTLPKFFGCLSNALRFIHIKGIKHMDIKPQNILVKLESFDEMVYFTDFGISREVQDLKNSQTNGHTGRTPLYSSPEVANDEPKGRSADVFSLGCVFAEMLTVLAHRTREQFRVARSDDGEAYHNNIALVVQWLQGLFSEYIEPCNVSAPTFGSWLSGRDFIDDCQTTISMLDVSPDKRPTAQELTGRFVPLCGFCSDGPIPFQI